jgi:deaminated glutathione amidase
MSIIAAVQMTSGPDVAANLQTAAQLLEEARAAGAQVALLPEEFSFIGQKDADKRGIAEDFGHGPVQDFLAATAVRLGLWIIGGSMSLKSSLSDGRVTNTCLVYNAEGRVVARYDKIHLFDVDVPDEPGATFRESANATRGGAAVLVDTPVGRIGLSVCYDVRFPELYRRLSAGGAEILVVPATFTVPTGRAHWELLLRARAVENLCYVVAADLSGLHPNGFESYGDSLIVDWWGRVLTRLPHGRGIVTTDIDRAAMTKARACFPALSHRVFES